MNEDIVVVEFFRDKLEKLQEEYDKLQHSYYRLVHTYELLKHQYDCCALDLKETQQELEDAYRTGYRNQHGSFSYPFGENN